MRSFLVLVALLVVSAFGAILALGFFGVIDLDYFYLDVVAITKGVNLDTYESSRNSFQVRYPSDWSIDERLIESKISISVRHPESNQVLASFRVELQDPAEDFEFDTFIDNQINTLRDERNRFKRLDQREVVLDGKRAIQLTFTFRIEGKDKQARYFWFVDEGSIYILSFETVAGDPDGFWPTLELMTSSFRVKESVGIGR